MEHSDIRWKYSKYDWTQFEENVPKEITFNNFGDLKRMQCSCLTIAKRKGELWKINKVGELTLRFVKLPAKVDQPE